MLSIWRFPKIRGTILGVPIIMTIVFWGLYWGSPILSTYHIFQPSGSYMPAAVLNCCKVMTFLALCPENTPLTSQLFGMQPLETFGPQPRGFRCANLEQDFCNPWYPGPSYYGLNKHARKSHNTF